MSRIYFASFISPSRPSLCSFDVYDSRHNVSHVFNAWTRMPELSKQIDIDGAFTTDLTVVRALLVKGLTYEGSVDAYEPYDRIQAPNETARAGMTTIVQRALKKQTTALRFVNNRL